jgi:type I restriction enzyme S subunit
MTPEGWRRTTYGQAMTETEERAGDNTTLPVLSVTKTRGPMLASERFGKVMHGRDLGKYRVAWRHSVVADPMLLWDGSIGLQTVVDAGLVSPDYRVYKPAPEVDPGFLGYLVRSPLMQPHYQGGARGTNVRRNRIARSDFLAIPMLQPPLGEQRRIAAILSSVDDAIESRQAVIDQLGVLKKAMMAELLTRGLPGRHTRFKTSEIGEVPEDWGVCPLGDVLSTIDSGWSPLCETRPANHDEWGVLKVSAVSWGEFRPDENKKLPGDLTPRPQLEVAPGDLLVSRANTPELVGRCVLVRRTRPRLMLSDKLLRLRARGDLATPGFIRLALETPSARQQIQDGATGSSRSMKNISQEKLRFVLLPRPSLVEQGSITRAFDDLAERITVEETCLDGLRTLKAGLMSVLLMGEVRVNREGTAA